MGNRALKGLRQYFMSEQGQSFYSPKSTAKQKLLNFTDTFIPQPQPSFWTRLHRRVKRSNKVSILSELILKEEVSVSQHLQQKQMELISDPVYTAVLKKKKQPILERIAEFTNFFKVFQPEAVWLIFWNIATALVILYYFFEIGLVIFLGQIVWLAELQSTITYFLNVLFILILTVDMFIQLNTGYYSEGILIMDKLRIVKQYFKKEFVIDFVSLVMVAACFFSQNMTLNYVKILFYSKVVSLRRIDQLHQKMLIFYIKWNMVYLMLRQIIMVILTTHYLGVIFFAIDNYVYTTNYYGPSTPLLSWIFNAQAYPQLIWQPWYIWFIYSFYFSLGTMTTIAYGDITPLNPIDTMYTILVLVVCCIQFSYVLYNILEIFFMGKAAESRKDEENLHLHKYLKTHFISHKLQVKVMAFIEEAWNSEMYRNKAIEEDMLLKLPNELRVELLGQVYHKFAVELLAFKYPGEFLAGLVSLIKEYRCSPQEILVTRREPMDSIFYVVSGRVSFYLTPKLHLKTLNETVIGVVEFYTQSQPDFSVITILDSNIYQIECSRFDSLIRSSQINLEIMKNIAAECRQESRKCQLFNMECFVCQQTSHSCFNCPNTHYIINPYKPNSFSSQFKQLRQKFMRSLVRRRHKKYMERRAKKMSEDEIGQKHKVTLQQISEMDLCGDMDFNNIQEFVDQTLQLLGDIENGLMVAEEREEELEESVQQMREFQVYMKSGNIRNVLRKMYEDK